MAAKRSAALDAPLEFDGQDTTLRAVIAKYTAYSDVWIRQAVREGCRTGEDFARRWAANQARSRLIGGQGGKAATLKHRRSFKRGD